MIKYMPAGSTLAATQTAVDAIIAAGTRGALVLSGAYEWEGTLSIVSATGLNVYGVGAVITQTATEDATIYLESCIDCEVSGLRLIGKGTETPWAAGAAWNGVAGIYYKSCTGLRIYSNKLTNHAGGGIVGSHTNTDVSIRWNTIIGMGTGSIEPGEHGYDGAVMPGVSSPVNYGLAVENNYIEGHSFGILGGGYAGPRSYSNNLIRNIAGQHGIYSGPPSATTGSFTVSGNTIDTCYGGDGIKVAAVPADADGQGVVNVVGNVLRNIRYNGISVKSQDTETPRYLLNVQVTDNNIVGSVGEFTSSYGILIDLCKGIVISGNRIKGAQNNAIYLDSSSGVLKGNVVIASDGAAVRLVDPAGDWSISDFECIDSPVNVADSVSVYQRSCLYLSGHAENATKVFLDSILMRYENVAEPAGTNALQYGINAVGANLSVDAGLVRNRTSKGNAVAGDLTEVWAGMVIPT